ncbi:MAG: hypothetical protein JW922_10035 [Paludibacteraceae bacterium]|nr:hypothetical protein [Paludibacteraceae bacterium]
MKIKPDINPNADLSFFTQDEWDIIQLFAHRDWYVTRTERIAIANSSYKLVLLKPLELIKNAFNINREVILVFSPYDTFEPRSIDAIDYLDIQELRLEEICSIIVSNDNEIETKLSGILKSNQETRIIIPFSYKELLEALSNPDYIINRIRAKFYSRDLFGIQDPLKKDLYFFGRKDLIHSLLNRHLNGENSGVFGLRKTGKTSILYSVERALDRKKSVGLFIDCQTLHLKSWINALIFIIEELQKSLVVKKSELKILTNEVTKDFVADYFHEDIKTIFKRNGKKSILLIFDEIEHITFDTSISDNWKKGIDFVKFWQVIRSSFQKHRTENIFTYLITGTNPRCIEVRTIEQTDNPIFAQFSPIYIPAFDVLQTTEMLDKLGGYMGIKFEDIVCSKLVEDFGGHPLLIRQMCSFLNKKIVDTRPISVSKVDYTKYRDDFFVNEQGFLIYISMVIEVLETWYQDEFQMITWLSIGDYDTFQEYANEVPEYITHLINYGIIEKSGIDYGFKIEAIKEYLAKKNKYQKLNLSNKEKQEEISARRNAIEPKLRIVVRRQLKATFGEENAKRKVISEIYRPQDYNLHSSKKYTDFFNPNKHNIYLNNLFELIRKNWENSFKNIFDSDIEEFNAKSTLLNKFRKPDAHAAQIKDCDFQSFRGAMEWFEQQIEEY